MNNGIVVILSGPSGCGKGTIMKKLSELNPNIVQSISATTRKKRRTEKDAIDYFFYTREEFEELIKQDQLLEYAEYNGNYYGTPRKPVEMCLKKDNDVILEIEIEGADKVRQYLKTVDIFVLPPSLKELEKRLRKRNSESDEQIASRLAIAKKEMQEIGKYMYVVINDDFEKAAFQINSIIQAERCRLPLQIDKIKKIVDLG